MGIQTPTELGRVIRERRDELGLTQEQVADVIGVNRRVVNRLEKGTGTVRLEIAMGVIRSLGLDLELRPRGR